jgi:signal peptidase II
MTAREIPIDSQTAEHATARAAALIGGVAVAGTLVLDQISKHFVLDQLGPGSTRREVEIIPGLLRLIFVRNTGSAFGLFQGGSDILKIIAIGAILLLAGYYARAAARDRLLALALGLQVGGALGNIVDRFRHGYVVDFINVPHWPTFNVADSAITIGVTLLVFTILFRDPNRDAQQGQRPIARPVASGEDG